VVLYTSPLRSYIRERSSQSIDFTRAWLWPCVTRWKNLLLLGCRSATATAGARFMKPKRTILCVDDNEQSLSIRKVMLETRGYRVVTCATGEEALQIFQRGGIDLVLTDLIMPGIDGSELIRAIKVMSPSTPTILFSGKVKMYERDTQADLFLPKGAYAPAELLERIRLMLVRKRGPKRIVPPLETMPAGVPLVPA
jgi:two-component system, OmpR family, response regulator CpxR